MSSDETDSEDAENDEDGGYSSLTIVASVGGFLVMTVVGSVVLFTIVYHIRTRRRRSHLARLSSSLGKGLG